ncbi:MAG: SDR family oxidoreductase [Hyphomicrobiales bacterium]
MEKVVIVTGASSGIGEALAKEYYNKQYKVVIAARNLDKLLALKADIASKEDNNILCVKTDVSIEEDCKHLVEIVMSTFGRIDILINNAGISMRAIFEDVDLDVLRRLMDTNFWGTVFCTKYALSHLQETKGSIVGVSSIAGYKGLPGRTGYSASKFAMHGFLETLRIENLKKGLHVLIACPGFTKSNIRNTSLSKDGSAQGESPRDEEKMMTSEEVASHIFKAVKSRKNTLVLTSQGKLTVLLNKFFPKFLDKMVYKTMAKEPNSPFK